MYEIEVKDISNNVVDKIQLNENVFEVNYGNSLLHEAVVNYLANQRQGTHATKTRGLVSGGGKKPWRQKHTGRARAGSIRSPLWRGGGIVFGPQPRDYSYDLPRKVKRLAFLTAFNEKLKANEVIVVDNLVIERPKTKEMIKIFNNLGLNGKSVLIVLPEKDENIILSARNIPRVSVMRVDDLNTYNILKYNFIMITKDAIKRLQEIKET